MALFEYPEDWAPIRKAIQFNIQQISELPNQFGSDLEGIKDLDWIDLAISLQTRIETVMPGERQVYHVVPDDVALYLAGAAQSYRDAYEILAEIARRNIVNSQPIPRHFQPVIFKVLSGEFDIPKRRGPKPSRSFGHKWVLRECALFTRDLFDLGLTRNEVSFSNDSACDAVVEAAHKLGFEISYIALRDWCVHKDYASFRQRADVLSNFLKDQFLLQSGVSKDWRKGHLFLSPL